MSDVDPTEIPTEKTGGPAELRRVPSVVLVNTGEGKGKSSAAFGVMLRALARDWKVAVVQFLKSGDWKVGEEKLGRRLGVDWFALGEGFTWDSKDLTEDQAMARAAWAKAKELIAAGGHDLVILDEITYPVSWGWLDADEVAGAIRHRPGPVNVIVTGRYAAQQLLDVADTVTEMVNVKHAFDAGIAAKRGIDY